MINLESVTKDKKIIFVDCFNTVILRKCKPKDVFKIWAKDLSNKFDIPYDVLLKLFKSINFRLCFKKIFSKFAFIENFDVVLEKMSIQLSKKYPNLDLAEFVNKARENYIQTEKMVQKYNEPLIEFLKKSKDEGKEIYIISDFYCSADIIKSWLHNLGILDIFLDVFSSCDQNKEKLSAGLYKTVLRHLNLNSKDVIMLGDNIWSDVIMARSCKIQAKKVKYKENKNGKKQDDN